MVKEELDSAKLDSPVKKPKAPSSSSSQHMLVKIAVGSSNPCKIEAVKQALQRVLDRKAEEEQKANEAGEEPTDKPFKVVLEVEGFGVESGVADQPFGDEETRTGAKNRAKKAYEEYKKKHGSNPALAIGLEGGLEWSSPMDDDEDEDSDEIIDTLWCMAWMAVYGKRRKLLVDLLASEDSKFYTEKQKPTFGLAKTGMFPLPSAIAKMVQDDMELGDADDKLFGRVNGKKSNGTVGILTNNVITRAEYYEQALILALVPWIRPDVYGNPFEKEPSPGFFGHLICSSRNGKK
ncbi:unnamed protein product [Cylindrotheca closterium]|uniref:inosine/xanthosine triphosphatase n=1 Tax=Cylindrotheca closterium TaxID=2856 RepID=A0AAD2FSU8_9STRA|nr:unnamed protein product [Cylindrotheca closterium]